MVGGLLRVEGLVGSAESWARGGRVWDRRGVIVWALRVRLALEAAIGARCWGGGGVRMVGCR